MRQHARYMAGPPLTLLALAIPLVLVNPPTVRAQGTQMNRQRNISKREADLRTIEMDTTTRKRDPREVLVEVNEDLGRLKILNEGISANATGNNESPNYKNIVESVAEIKKRATRLKGSLALPKEENEEKSAGFKDAEKAELQLALTELSKLLDSFLHNPIFSDSGPLDMRLAAKARRDLEDIIVLSEKVRKNAEKRSKSPGNIP